MAHTVDQKPLAKTQPATHIIRYMSVKKLSIDFSL